MLLDVEHRLTFSYDDFVCESSVELRIEPRATAHQTVHSFLVAVGPRTKVFRYTDWNDNVVHHFGISEYHDRILVIARSLVHTRPEYPLPATVADRLPVAGADGALLDLTGFGGPVRDSARLRELEAETAVGPDAPLGAQIEAIGSLVHGHLRYLPDVTTYRSTTDDALEHGAGVCQDFAHVALALLRLRGIPCRYVSGYLHVEPHGGAPAQSHAWVEVWSPAAGWVAFDPTHARVPDEHYVVVGHGRHYDDVPPNRGIYRGGALETLVAEVRTRPTDERRGLAAQPEAGEIDLPVYREVPLRTPRAPDTVPDQDDEQQQQ